MKPVAIGLLLALASCSDTDSGANQASGPPDLETAAIERGLVRDPGDRDPTGLYARDTDRLCVVPQGDAYRVGAFVDYGDGLSCAGSGRATRSGEQLTIELKGKDRATCRIEAKFDGDRLSFPATVPAECAQLCGPRASFAALQVERLSESTAEAAALRSPDGDPLCGS